MKIKKKKSFIIHIRPSRLKIAWFKLLLGAVVILLGASYLEQHKFYLDANTIYIYYNRVKGSWIPERIGDGYPNTARFYRLFFFNQDLSLHTFFVLCSIFYCFVYQWMVSKMKIKNGDWFLIFSTCFIFDCIYMFQPSKEITAMILSILILNQLRKAGRKRYLWAGLLILCYALIFRIYYLFLTQTSHIDFSYAS